MPPFVTSGSLLREVDCLRALTTSFAEGSSPVAVYQLARDAAKFAGSLDFGCWREHCSDQKQLAHGLLQQMSLGLHRLDWVGPLLLVEAEIGRIPDSIPGVYMLMAFVPASGKYGSLNCGQASDLRARLIQHSLSGSTARDFIVLRRQITTYFTAAPVLRRPVRLAVEAGLIALLRPPLNRQVPRCSPVFPSLPSWALPN
jgi:hypothetical protein